MTQTVQFLEQISFKGQKMGWRTYTWTTFQFKDFIWHLVQRNQKVCFQRHSKTFVGFECSVDTSGYLKNYCLLSYEKHYCGYLSKESLSFRDSYWNFYGWEDIMATISFKITHGRWVGRLQMRCYQPWGNRCWCWVTGRGGLNIPLLLLLYVWHFPQEV